MQLTVPPMMKETAIKQTPIILIVDDQIDNIQILALFLETQGYSVSYALNAAETLQRLNAVQPDLILLDLFMPDVNGLDLCKQIKANPYYQDIPIIFVTASHDEEHIVSAFARGAADYVMKPFNTRELLARAATHIKLRQQTNELRQTRDKLDTIVTYIQDGLLVTNDLGIIQFANPAAAQMFGKSVDDLVGYPLGQPLVDRKLTRIEILRLNGEPGIAEITVGSAIWNDRPVSIICLRDITDLRDTAKDPFWGNLHRSLMIDQLRGFALKLETWAITYEYPEIQSYALSLMDQLDQFDLIHLPETVSILPQLKLSLERLLQSDQ